MSADDISNDLLAFERRLQDRTMLDPSAALQFRIMRDVSRELSNSTLTIQSGGDFLSFAAAMAAVLLIGLNLSLIATSNTALDSRSRISFHGTSADATALRNLSPELSEADAVQIAVLLQMGGDVTPLPEVFAPISYRSAEAARLNDERYFQ